MWRYWQWFFFGLSGKPGYLKFLDLWLLFHVFVGACCAIFIKSKLQDEATTIILPLAGVFVGLTFAWSGNAQALMQSDELAEMFERHPDGLENYVYNFQNAILCLLTTMVGWAFAGLGIFHEFFSHEDFARTIVKAALFTLSSISIRECWHVIMGSQIFILAQRNIRKQRSETD